MSASRIPWHLLKRLHGVSYKPAQPWKPPMQVNLVSNNVAENLRRFERQFRVYYMQRVRLLPSLSRRRWAYCCTRNVLWDVHETFTYTGD